MLLVILYSARMDFELRFHYTNLAKHNVAPKEVEDCFLDSRRLVRRVGKGIYWLIGRTEAGRLLQIGYRREPGNVAYVFHAMNAQAAEHKQYTKRGK